MTFCFQSGAGTQRSKNIQSEYYTNLYTSMIKLLRSSFFFKTALQMLDF